MPTFMGWMIALGTIDLIMAAFCGNYSHVELACQDSGHGSHLSDSSMNSPVAEVGTDSRIFGRELIKHRDYRTQSDTHPGITP